MAVTGQTKGECPVVGRRHERRDQTGKLLLPSKLCSNEAAV